MASPTTATHHPFGDALVSGAHWLAIGGGLTLSCMALLTIVSVIGRETLGQTVPGDFELLEIGCAISIFAFLPYCHLTRGNVIVDLFTQRIRRRTRNRLDALANAVFTLIAATVTWRLAVGGIDMFAFGQHTMVLRIPLWWGFAPSVLSCAFLTVICAYTVWRPEPIVRYGHLLHEAETFR